MSLGFGFGFTKITAAIRAAFSPSSLFAANEPGVWFDPSDLSTLYQGAAGTTPVTAVEQPVGLILDKSRGLALGPELVTNGDFSDGTTGWTLGAGWNISGGAAEHAVGNSGSISQTVSAVAGRFYEVSFNVMSIGGVSPSISARIGSGSSLVTITGTGQKRFIQTPTGGTLGSLQISASNSTSVVVDNISVRELPGNHAYQTTATSRPVLSARYNLLTKTEQFDDAVWSFFNVSGGASRVGNTITFGTSPVDRFSQGGITLETISYTASIILSGTGSVRLYLLGGDGNTSIPTTVTLTSTPTRYSVTRTPSASGFNGGIGIYNNASGTPSTVTISFPDVRPTDNGVNLPPYQRVNTATDYDTAKFPHYLRFDGVDDWLVTNTITPGTDKAQVFAGVRRLSDAVPSAVVELSANSQTINGGLAMFAPLFTAQLEYAFIARGDAQNNMVARSYAAPITGVVCGLLSSAAANSTEAISIRVNGGTPPTLATSQSAVSTGDFGNYPLYIGRRGGTSNPFNGYIYSLIVRFGSNLPIATIEKTEKYINTKTGAY